MNEHENHVANSKAVLCGLLVFCLVNIILFAYLDHEREQSIHKLGIEAIQWVERIGSKHETNIDRQRQMAALFVASNQVTETEFKRFANYRMGLTMSHETLGWVPFSDAGTQGAVNPSVGTTVQEPPVVKYLSGSPRYNFLAGQEFNKVFPSCSYVKERMGHTRESVICIPDMANVPPLSESFTDAFLVATPIIEGMEAEPVGMIFGIYAFGKPMLESAPATDLGLYGYLFVEEEIGYRAVYSYGSGVSRADVPQLSLDDIRRKKFHIIRKLSVGGTSPVIAFTAEKGEFLLADQIDWLAFFIFIMSIIGGVEAFYLVKVAQRRHQLRRLAQNNANHLKMLIDRSLGKLCTTSRAHKIWSFSRAICAKQHHLLFRLVCSQPYG